MTVRIKTRGKKLSSIRSTSKQAPDIDPARVISGLGTETPGESTAEPGGSPPALFALRQELFERLCSTGGRRSLDGTTRRQKIPLTDKDWEHLQKLAEQSQSDGLRPTPGQVASVLLHQTLEALERDKS